MRAAALAILIGCHLMPGAAPELTENPDQSALAGKWMVTSFEFDGGALDDMQRAVREFSGERYSLTPDSGETYTGTYRLDTQRQPKQIDLVLNERTLKGIYAMEGDELKLAYSLDGEERPTEFASKPGSGVALAIHKRLKR